TGWVRCRQSRQGADDVDPVGPASPSHLLPRSPRQAARASPLRGKKKAPWECPSRPVRRSDHAAAVPRQTRQSIRPLTGWQRQSITGTWTTNLLDSGSGSSAKLAAVLVPRGASTAAKSVYTVSTPAALKCLQLLPYLSYASGIGKVLLRQT